MTRAEFEAFADYTDGKSAKVERLGLELERDALLLEDARGDQMRWPLAGLRALPDQADRDGIVLFPEHDDLRRLTLRQKEFADRIRAVAPHLNRRPPVKNWSAIGRWAAGAVASVAVIVFVLVPILANQLAEFIPVEGERALGVATYEQVRKALGENFEPARICNAPQGQAALQAMEERLDPGDDLPFPVNVTVLDHPMVNAFALPGGQVVLFRGLLEDAARADEVAAVLAHEIGHVVNRDPTRDALRSAGSIGVLGLLFGDFAGGTLVLLLANQLINAKYSQSAETGADDYAHDLLTRHGYDPAALGSFFERLKDEHGDAEGILAHLSTHPQMQARIAAAQDAAARSGVTPKPILSDAEWTALQDICGPQSSSSQDDSEALDAEKGGGGLIVPEREDADFGGGLGGAN